MPFKERDYSIDKMIRHYKAIVIDNDIPIKGICKTIGRATRGRAIEEIDIPNISVLIEEYNLDPKYNIYSSRQNWIYRARSGKLKEEDVKKLLDIGILTEEMLVPSNQRESRASKVIRHCKALTDRKINIQNLQLLRTINEKQVSLKLHELEIENIEEIINEDELDRDFDLRTQIAWIRKNYNSGELTEEEAKEAESLPRIAYKKEERTKIKKKRRNETSNCIL